MSGPPAHVRALAPGMQFLSQPRRVTLEDLRAFAEVSHDRHPMHTDPAYAANTPFGAVIAHGPFGVALAFGLYNTIPQLEGMAIAMLDLREWKFTKPIFVGDELRIRLTIGEIRQTRSGREIVDRLFEIVRADGDVVQSGWSAMIVNGPGGAEAG